MLRCPKLLTAPWLRWVIVAGLGVPSALQASPEPPPAALPQNASGQEETFHDQEVVTAVDVMVGFEPGMLGAVKNWSRGLKLPTDLTLDSFEAVVDSQARTLVALEEVHEGVPVATEPWTQVIYIDVQGSRSRDLRMALDWLGQRVEPMLRLGSVEVVQRRSELERVLTPTRNSDELERVLSQLALTVEGADDLTDVRYELRRELMDASWPRPAAQRRIDKAWRLEQERAIRHQDALLALLVERAAEAGPRRVVYWLSSGFDPNPADYYGVTFASESIKATDPQAIDFGAESESMGRALASYGWVVLPVVPAPPDPLRGRGSGKRLGKLRFTGLMATYEAERRPERAEALLELAEAHRGGGRWEDAQESYDRAYYHFGGDPRTADRQALVLARMSETLERLGRHTESRRTLEMAFQLDPGGTSTLLQNNVMERAAKGFWAIRESGEAPGMLSVQDRMRFAHGGLDRRTSPLSATAAASSGRLVDGLQALDEVLDDLRLRLRLTVQLPGEAEGRVLPLQVLPSDGNGTVRTRRWMRSGVPERVSRALARMQLRHGPEVQGQGLEPLLTVTPLEMDAGALKVRVAQRPAAGPPTDLRLVISVGGGDQPSRTQVWTLSATDSEAFDVTLGVEEPRLSVLWQDPSSGVWGGRRFETGLD